MDIKIYYVITFSYDSDKNKIYNDIYGACHTLEDIHLKLSNIMCKLLQDIDWHLNWENTTHTYNLFL